MAEVAMDKDAFADFLDASWEDFRQHILDAIPESAPSPTFTSSGAFTSSGGAVHTRRHASKAKMGTNGGGRVNGKHGDDDDDDETGCVITDLNGNDLLELRNFNDHSVDSTGSKDSCASATSAASNGSMWVAQRDSQHVLTSALAEKSAEEIRSVRNRLRLRLGTVSSNTLVTGKSLLDAVQALGLTKYSEEDVNAMLNQLADFIGLYFEAKDSEKRTSRSYGLFKFTHDAADFGKPHWAWPGREVKEMTRRSFTTSLAEVSQSVHKCNYNCAPSKAVVDVFLAEETEVFKKIFSPRILKQFVAMREILLAGDTNRLVAELTFVRINDLAAPPEPVHPLTYLEPFIAILIVGNGVMIGFQTDPNYADWNGWIFIELFFGAFLVLEIMARMHLLRCWPYWCGPEKLWNWFDLFLACTSLTDLGLLLAAGNDKTEASGTSLLRFFRLIRLVRIVKVFRIKFMRDLRLMVKGLVAGIRTLVLAFMLLFTVLYVISGFAAMSIGSSPETVELGLQPFFETIPASMFTAFRCFTGECVNDAGQPIHSLLAAEFGLPFIAGYVASYMLVSMGIFNVILAVYVDITMKAAKENDSLNAEQYSRESIRIARITRELVKKFSMAYHMFHEEAEGEKAEESRAKLLASLGGAAWYAEDGMQDKIAITKDLFLLIIQDHAVQGLMDDLDLPPDRANLFEIIDADGSGTLQITELLHGLLKIRGEINKSDAVASLLATRAVQTMVAVLQEESAMQLEKTKELSESVSELRLQMAGLAEQRSKPTRSSIRLSFVSQKASRAAREAAPLSRLKLPARPDLPEMEDAPPNPS
ncbi:unnamed protein product [Effrenium voratum]|nr:unnamed protein product [Effrenium voratum]